MHLRKLTSCRPEAGAAHSRIECLVNLVPSPSLLERLRAIAAERGVDAQRLLDEAIEQFVVAASITDVSGEDIAGAQEEMMSELDFEEWDKRSGA